jgi:hypothetical protein
MMENTDSPRGTSEYSYKTLANETQHCASILLLNAAQNLNDVLKEKFALKADDSFTLESALGKLKKSMSRKCNCPPYSHFIVDFEKETSTMMLRQISARIKEIYPNEARKLQVVILAGRKTPENLLKQMREEC